LIIDGVKSVFRKGKDRFKRKSKSIHNQLLKFLINLQRTDKRVIIMDSKNKRLRDRMDEKIRNVDGLT